MGVIAGCFGLVNAVQFLLLQKKPPGLLERSCPSKCQIETARTRNSKWAVVSYEVDGRLVQSGNRIQVPMTSQVGSFVHVRYDKQEPEKLYAFSLGRMAVAFLVAVVCFFIVRIAIGIRLWGCVFILWQRMRCSVV